MSLRARQPWRNTLKSGRGACLSIGLLAGWLLGAFVNFTTIESWWYQRGKRIDPLSAPNNRTLFEANTHPSIVVENAQDGDEGDGLPVLDVYLRNDGQEDVVFNRLTFPPYAFAAILSPHSTAPSSDLPDIVYRIAMDRKSRREAALSPPLVVPAGHRRAIRIVLESKDGGDLAAVPGLYLHDTAGNSAVVGQLWNGSPLLEPPSVDPE